MPRIIRLPSRMVRFPVRLRDRFRGVFHRHLCQRARPARLAGRDGSSWFSAVVVNLVTPRVLIGGIEATVLFSGLAPEFVGVNQVNVVVPPEAPTGSAVPLQISVGGVITSSRVTIAIQP